MAKWESDQEDGPSADAVTGDLRTQQNRLSLWRAATATDIENAVLAMAAEGTRVDKLDVAWIPEDQLDTGFSLENTPGQTRVADLVDTHVDLLELNYARLGRFAEQLHLRFTSGDRKRFTKTKVTELLASAVKDQRVAIKDLKSGVREVVETAIQSPSG